MSLPWSVNRNIHNERRKGAGVKILTPALMIDTAFHMRFSKKTPNTDIVIYSVSWCNILDNNLRFQHRSWVKRFPAESGIQRFRGWALVALTQWNQWLRAHSKITSHFRRQYIPLDCVVKTRNMPDIPAFPRLDRRAPQHLKLRTYFSWTLREKAQSG